MLRTTSRLGFLALLLVGAGCYHATIETGATPSPMVVRNGFASSWIYGLVPPSTVSTASKCPDGVARVETQLSFVNGLVGVLTLGIYTPMEIMVTCAASRSASAALSAQSDYVEFDAASPTGFQEALALAITRSRDEGRAIYTRAR